VTSELIDKDTNGQVKYKCPEPTTDKPKTKNYWANRSNMTCITCIWYVKKFKSLSSLSTTPIGRCRRHAPTLDGYPVVFETDWCGDHKLNENCR